MPNNMHDSATIRVVIFKGVQMSICFGDHGNSRKFT